MIPLLIRAPIGLLLLDLPSDRPLLWEPQLSPDPPPLPLPPPPALARQVTCRVIQSMIPKAAIRISFFIFRPVILLFDAVSLLPLWFLMYHPK